MLNIGHLKKNSQGRKVDRQNLTVQELAKILDVTRQTIYNQINKLELEEHTNNRGTRVLTIDQQNKLHIAIKGKEWTTTNTSDSTDLTSELDKLVKQLDQFSQELDAKNEQINSLHQLLSQQQQLQAQAQSRVKELETQKQLLIERSQTTETELNKEKAKKWYQKLFNLD